MANLRVKKKHLDENSVDGSKIKLSANEALRGVDKDSTEVELLKLDGDNKLIGYGYELARKVDLESETSSRVAGDEAEQSERMAADAALSSDISAEVAARESADLVEKTERMAADAALSSDLSTEVAARESADLVEKSERMAADAALSSDISAEVAARESADLVEKSERMAADEAVMATIRGNVSSSYDTLEKIEDRIEFIVSNVDPDALDSLTEIVDAFQAADGTLNQAISNLSNAATTAVENEKTERMAADAALSSDISAEVAARESADLVEKSERMAADAALSSDLSTEVAARESADLVEKSERMAADAALSSDISAEVAARESADLVEKSERMAADAALQAAIDAEVTSRQAAIASLVDSAPEVLDTLNELAAALGDDANFATTVTNRLSDIETSLTQSAANSEDYTDQKVQELKDLISDTLLRKDSYVLTSQNVADGYVVLTGTSVIGNSVSAFKDRLSIFEGEDFTISVVGNETRLVFINSYASNGEEAIESGDELRVTYWSFA